MPTNKYISAVKGYLRLGNFPLDASSIFPSVSEAIQYAASNPTAYAGQLISVVNESEHSVTVYQLGFPDANNNPGNANYEIQEIASGSAGGTVRSVNNIAPDGNANITINANDIKISSQGSAYDAQDIQTLLLNLLALTAPMTNTESEVVFSKPISTPKITVQPFEVTSPNDIVTAGYLQSKLDIATEGSKTTVKLTFGPGGGSSSVDILANALVSRVIVKILQPFNQPISIKIGNYTVVDEEEIFETETSTFIKDVTYTVPTPTLESDTEVKAITSSTQGLGEVYVVYIGDFLD
jgi:hypothetical protein